MPTPLRHLLTALAVTVCALAATAQPPPASGAAPTPARITPAPPAPLNQRTVRVGLPSPLGARGMLRGDKEDPQGFLRELMVLLAQAEGFSVEFVPLDRGGGVDHREALTKGTIDVIAGSSVAESNLRSFRLTAPVVVTPGVAVTRKGAPRVSTVEDLRRLRNVVVPVAGAGHTFAAEHDIAVTPVRMYPDAFTAVVSGEADALLTTQIAANAQIERAGMDNLNVTVLEPVGFRRAYAYAVRADDAELLAALDTGIVRLERDGRFGELYRQEVERYQPIDGPTNIPLSRALHVGTALVVALAALAAAWQWRTHRRVAAMARGLAESEARYRGIFDHSQDAVLLVDPHRRTVIEANPAAERMYGFDRGAMSGVAILDLAADRVAAEQRIDSLLREGSLMVLRSRHRRRDGRTISVEVHAATGTIGGRAVAVSIIRDVTAAAAQESLLHSVIDLSPHVAIQGYDREGRVTFWNAASERIYGWPAPDAIGRTMGELIADPQAHRELVELFRTLEREGRSSGLLEFTVHSRAGESRHVLSEIVPTTDALGEPRFVCVDIDVTEARQKAADADRLRDELERARRLESLGLLAGGLAHDFNNLLVGIRGNSELAMRDVPPQSPAFRALELVVQATDRTAELTQQLLAAAGRSRLEPVPVDLNAVAVESVDLLRHRLGASVEIAFDLCDPPARTLADGAQTRQAVANLLTNAADALAGRRGARITVRTGATALRRADLDDPAYKARAAPGEYTYIEVEDNGPGMDERILARIFDPFYTTKATGRGLGLSLVMMTVRRHEGAIRIRSRPGQGTVCRMLLPLRSVSADGRQVADSGGAAAPGFAVVIDDEPMVRSVISAMLRAEGWRIHEAASGEEAVRAAATDRFDAAFVDLTMPGMSGVETAAALRAALPGLPIVFVSGYNREMAESTGALDHEVFVQKPFDAQRLMQALAEAIAKQARR